MKRHIALDANLTILLVVGLTDPRLISKHKRLKAYDLKAWTLLKEAIGNSAGVLVTPNTLSEASNLLRQIGDPDKTRIMNTFRAFIQSAKETHVTSNDASSRNEFIRLGLADCALLEVAKDDILILSVDVGLCLAAQTAGYEAWNFIHTWKGP